MRKLSCIFVIQEPGFSSYNNSQHLLTSFKQLLPFAGTKNLHSHPKCTRIVYTAPLDKETKTCDGQIICQGAGI